MCNKKPGTRCSPHALEAVESAKKDLDAAFRHVKTDRTSKSILQFQDAKKKLEDAQFEYSLSPDGQKILTIQLSSATKGSPERADLSKQFGLTQRCIERRRGALAELEGPVSQSEVIHAKKETQRYLMGYTDQSASSSDQVIQISALTKELNSDYEAMSRQLVEHLNTDGSDVGTKARLINYMRTNRLVADSLEKERHRISTKSRQLVGA